MDKCVCACSSVNIEIVSTDVCLKILVFMIDLFFFICILYKAEKVQCDVA